MGRWLVGGIGAVCVFSATIFTAINSGVTFLGSTGVEVGTIALRFIKVSTTNAGFHKKRAVQTCFFKHDTTRALGRDQAGTAKICLSENSSLKIPPPTPATLEEFRPGQISQP